METVGEIFTSVAEITGTRYFNPSRPAEAKWRIYGTGTTIPLTDAARQRAKDKRANGILPCSLLSGTANFPAAS